MVKERELAEELELQNKAESFGEYLARERRLRNISLEEISQRTRISMKMLRALEEGRWEDLPAEVYVKGFLRSYARYVGLDENEVILRYESYRPAKAKDSPRELVFQGRPLTRRLWILGILGLLGIGLAFLWFLHKRSTQGTGSIAGPSMETAYPAPPGPTMRSQPMPPPPGSGN